MTTNTSSTSTSAPKSVMERCDELTGRDEVAVAEFFGHDIWDTYDAAADPDAPASRKISSRLGRMLIFAEKLHDGLPPTVAYDLVMNMTVTDVNDFLRLADEAADDTGDTAADGTVEGPEGKDDGGDA